MTQHRRITMTRHAGPHTRVREALEVALSLELALDSTMHARTAIEAAELDRRVEQYADELDVVLDELVGRVIAQTRPLAQERNAIHQAANDHERHRLADADRIDGTFVGVGVMA